MPLIQAMYSNKSNLKFFSFKVSVIYKFNKAQTFDRYIYFFKFLLTTKYNHKHTEEWEVHLCH